jgi:hypothetical protein
VKKMEALVAISQRLEDNVNCLGLAFLLDVVVGMGVRCQRQDGVGLLAMRFRHREKGS